MSSLSEDSEDEPHPYYNCNHQNESINNNNNNNSMVLIYDETIIHNHSPNNNNNNNSVRNVAIVDDNYHHHHYDSFHYGLGSRHHYSNGNENDNDNEIFMDALDSVKSIPPIHDTNIHDNPYSTASRNNKSRTNIMSSLSKYYHQLASLNAPSTCCVQI